MKNEVITLTKQPDGSFAFEIPPAEEKKEAVLHNSITSAGILDKIPAYQIMGIPIGAAAKAMLVAGVGDAAGLLAIKFLPASILSGSYSVALLKALTIAGLNWHPIKKFIGNDAVELGSIILAYEGISSIFNARLKIYQLLAKVTNKVGGSTTVAATTQSGIETIS